MSTYPCLVHINVACPVTKIQPQTGQDYSPCKGKTSPYPDIAPQRIIGNDALGDFDLNPLAFL